MRVEGANRNENLTKIPEAAVNVVVGDSQSKPTIHNVFIVDASGSMRGGKYNNAMIGLNELRNSIKKDTNTNNTLTIVEFEDTNIQTRLDFVTTIPDHYDGMGTGSMTPLNQAVGETLERTFKKRKDSFNEEDKVLVSIFTDGGENSSMGKYANDSQGRATVLASFIKELEAKGFTITFIGTKEEVNYAINTLNMKASNTLVHNNTSADVARSFSRTVTARESYSKSVSLGEVVTENFYTKSVD